jgi:uncharacterized membrane protein YkvA (DUF1232 family)
MLVRILIGIAAGLLLSWVALVIALALARPRGGLLVEAVRIVPDAVRLMRTLATDPALPRGVRVRLGLLLVYLALPFDLVPDFVPVLGYADDAILVAWVLRSVLRAAGPDAIRRSWPGTPDGLAALWRVLRLPGADASP